MVREREQGVWKTRKEGKSRTQPVSVGWARGFPGCAPRAGIDKGFAQCGGRMNPHICKWNIQVESLTEGPRV